MQQSPCLRIRSQRNIPVSDCNETRIRARRSGGRSVGAGAALGLLGVVLMTASPVAARQDVTGIWYDSTGKGAVELSRCGRSICGQIVWLRQPVNDAGVPLTDANNPRAALRERPICGLSIVSGLRAQPDGTWDGGRIYDPKVGKSYNVAIEKVGRSQLRITGYLGVRFLGKSFI